MKKIKNNNSSTVSQSKIANGTVDEMKAKRYLNVKLRHHTIKPKNRNGIKRPDTVKKNCFALACIEGGTPPGPAGAIIGGGPAPATNIWGWIGTITLLGNSTIGSPPGPQIWQKYKNLNLPNIS